jgi:hypothetical protein
MFADRDRNSFCLPVTEGSSSRKKPSLPLLGGDLAMRAYCGTTGWPGAIIAPATIKTTPTTCIRNGRLVSSQCIATNTRLTIGMKSEPNPHKTLVLNVITSNHTTPTSAITSPSMDKATILFPLDIKLRQENVCLAAYRFSAFD